MWPTRHASASALTSTMSPGAAAVLLALVLWTGAARFAAGSSTGAASQKPYQVRRRCNQASDSYTPNPIKPSASQQLAGPLLPPYCRCAPTRLSWPKWVQLSPLRLASRANWWCVVARPNWRDAFRCCAATCLAGESCSPPAWPDRLVRTQMPKTNFLCCPTLMPFPYAFSSPSLWTGANGA